MLPLGRSEDVLVLSDFAIKGINAFAAETGKELAGLQLLDFHAVLQDDPMLAAEMCTQAAVLDFGADSTAYPKDSDNETMDTGIELDEKVNASPIVMPSDSKMKAFVCVAKLKLCRLACAYRDIYAQEE